MRSQRARGLETQVSEAGDTGISSWRHRYQQLETQVSEAGDTGISTRRHRYQQLETQVLAAGDMCTGVGLLVPVHAGFLDAQASQDEMIVTH